MKFPKTQPCPLMAAAINTTEWWRWSAKNKNGHYSGGSRMFKSSEVGNCKDVQEKTSSSVWLK